MYTDTAGGLLITATVPAADRFGSRVLGAVEPKRVSSTVNIEAGPFTNVDTLKTSQSRAFRVWAGSLKYAYEL